MSQQQVKERFQDSFRPVFFTGVPGENIFFSENIFQQHQIIEIPGGNRFLGRFMKTGFSKGTQ